VSIARTALTWFEIFILSYFSILILLYTLSGFLGLRAIIAYARRRSPTALKDLAEHDFYRPISMLVPAYNEDQTIVHNVRAMLALDYPEFEVIVAVDGSTDATLDRLVEGFSLVEIPPAYRRVLDSGTVRATYRSLTHPNLSVVDKVNGGKADASNAALNIAKYPIICVVDADCLLDPDALLRAARVFGEDESVIAVGGTLRPLNGAVVRDGRVVDARAPKRWVERFQVLEYTRAFFAYRAGWSHINCLMIISGGFGLFRRDALIEVGGWRRGYVADDMEVVVHLHRHFREQRRRYRIVFTPDPICWTEVPSTFKALRKQRDGWQRGLLEVLWHHRVMLCNPRYGRAGLIGIPFMWVFEAAAAEIEALGYIVIVVTAILGMLNVAFAILFLAMALLFSVLISQLAFGLETLLLDRYPRMSDRLALFASAFIEFLGYHQVIAFVRATSVFRVRSRHGKYWTTDRAGLVVGDNEHADDDRQPAVVDGVS